MSDSASPQLSGSRGNRLARRFLIGLLVLTALGLGYSFGADFLPVFARENMIKLGQLSRFTGEFESGPYDSDYFSFSHSKDNGTRPVWLRILDPGSSVTPYAGQLDLHYVKETEPTFVGSSKGAILKAEKIMIALQKSATSGDLPYEFHVRIDPVLQDQVEVEPSIEGVAVRLSFAPEPNRKVWRARLEGTAPPDSFEVVMGIPNPLPVSENIEGRIRTAMDVFADKPCTEDPPTLRDFPIELVSFGTHEWLPRGGGHDIHPLDPVAGMRAFCTGVTPGEEKPQDEEKLKGKWGVTLVLKIQDESSDGLFLKSKEQFESITLLHAYGF